MTHTKGYPGPFPGNTRKMFIIGSRLIRLSVVWEVALHLKSDKTHKSWITAQQRQWIMPYFFNSFSCIYLPDPGGRPTKGFVGRSVCRSLFSYPNQQGRSGITRSPGLVLWRQSGASRWAGLGSGRAGLTFFRPVLSSTLRYTHQ